MQRCRGPSEVSNGFLGTRIETTPCWPTTLRACRWGGLSRAVGAAGAGGPARAGEGLRFQAFVVSGGADDAQIIMRMLPRGSQVHGGTAAVGSSRQQRPARAGATGARARPFPLRNPSRSGVAHCMLSPNPGSAPRPSWAEQERTLNALAPVPASKNRPTLGRRASRLWSRVLGRSGVARAAAQSGGSPLQPGRPLAPRAPACAQHPAQ